MDFPFSSPTPLSWDRRVVLPEMLDALPADDPRARKARHELDLFNLLMGNHSWIEQQVARFREPDHRLLEIGAGSGTLGKRLVQRNVWPEFSLIGMDTTPRPLAWPLHAEWVQGDVLQEPLPDAEVVVVNLLLHQFTDAQLAAFGRAVPRCCHTLIAVEPLRSRAALVMGRMVAWLSRASTVTRYDMVASLHAGFRGNELPSALHMPGWAVRVTTTLRGGYRLLMQRDAALITTLPLALA